jgi:hypothetical protein
LHAVVLARNRLLDLQDQLRVLPDVLAAGRDLGTCGCELIVGDRRADASTGLDEHLVAIPGELMDPGWGNGDPIFMVLDLSGYADPHSSS